MAARFEGDVSIEGFGDLSNRNNGVALRKKVGTVFATPIPLPRSIYENIVFGVKLKGIKKRSELQCNYRGEPEEGLSVG